MTLARGYFTLIQKFLTETLAWYLSMQPDLSICQRYSGFKAKWYTVHSVLVPCIFNILIRQQAGQCPSVEDIIFINTYLNNRAQLIYQSFIFFLSGKTMGIIYHQKQKYGIIFGLGHCGDCPASQIFGVKTIKKQ